MTGGAGYIGSIVAVHLLRAGHEVVVLDDLRTGHADTIDRIAAHAPAGAPLSFHQLGIDRAGEVLGEGIEGVLHFAALALVPESVTAPERYWHTNVGGSLALLDAMREAGVGRLVFSSTCATYGDPDRARIDETTPTMPVNAYGASKLAVDHIISSYAIAHGLAATSLRYFNVVGALTGDGSPALGERHDPETHLVPRLLTAARDGSPVSVFGTDYPTPDGTAIRDYLHVADLADAHLSALDRLQPGRHAIYNLGTASGSSVREVIAAVEAVTGRTLDVREEDRRAGDPPALVASGARAAAELDWIPHRSLTQAIGDAWAALQA
ncbi:UDP-glucose 4-epimerase GalE [soil metagenome]